MPLITPSIRLQRIKESPTLAVSARANKLKAEGHDVINLSAGEPDFDTPDHIKAAAIKAIQDGFTKYTAVDGIPGLKRAIIQKLSRENQLAYEPAQIIVSCGIKQGIYNLMQAWLNSGDEVVIPAPYWVSYPDMALLADAKPVFIHTDRQQKFKITPEQLDRAITPKTRLFIMNSPSNPTGMVYTRAELASLAEVLVRHPQVLILTDDMYEHILWSGEPFTNILNVYPELYERTVVFNGVSKSHAMTGWRIGYAAGPQPLIKAMTNIQSQSTSNPNSIAQVAAQAALEGDQQCVHDMARAFQERHALVAEKLLEIDGVEYCPAQGTFYSFPDVSALIARLPDIDSDLAFAEYLLTKAGVAVVPGSAFGGAGCIRISFATSTDLLRQAMSRIQEALKSY